MHIDMTIKEEYKEPLRFIVTGIVATAMHYAIYWMLIGYIGISLAWSIGYIISFVANYLMTTFFTFKVKPGMKKAGGFAFSHVINWALQTGCLNFFVFIGIDKVWAPIPVYAVCVPINFMLVRFFMKKSE